MDVKQFADALVRELDFRAPNAKSREAREAIQSIKHAVEQIIGRTACKLCNDSGYVTSEMSTSQKPFELRTCPHGCKPAMIRSTT